MLKIVDYDIVFAEVPDEVSLALNLSRCPNHCKGCHSPQLWRDIGEPLTYGRMASLVERFSSGITCVCFMGGDADTDSLLDINSFLRSNYPSLKLAWYSGKPELPMGMPAEKWDYVKLGPYIPQYGPLNRKTTNQRFYRIRREVHTHAAMEDITARFLKENY